MLIPILGVEDIADVQTVNLLASPLPRMHVNLAVEHDKDFGTIVDVPLIGPICPMKSNGGTANLFDAYCFPSPGAGKALRAY